MTMASSTSTSFLRDVAAVILRSGSRGARARTPRDGYAGCHFDTGGKGSAGLWVTTMRTMATAAADRTNAAVTVTKGHSMSSHCGHHRQHHRKTIMRRGSRMANAAPLSTTTLNNDGGGIDGAVEGGRVDEEGSGDDGRALVGMEALLEDEEDDDYESGVEEVIDDSSRESGNRRLQPMGAAGMPEGRGDSADHHSVAGDNGGSDDHDILEEDASKIARYPPGFLTLECQNSYERMDRITDVMRRARDLRSVRGARIAESMLNKVLAEGEWWHSTEEERGMDIQRLHPTRIMYSLAIDSWAKSVDEGRDDGAGRRDDRRGGVGRRRYRAERAEAILDLMQSHHEFHVQRSSGSGGYDDEEGGRPPRPDAICFTSVMNAHANAGDADRAQSLLERMIRLSDDDDGHRSSSSDRSFNPDVRPDIYAFLTVLSAWTKHHRGDPRIGLSRARELVERMHHLSSSNPERYRHVRPDTRTYNTLLHAYVNCSDHKNPWAAAEAQKILDSMLLKSSSSDEEAASRDDVGSVGGGGDGIRAIAGAPPRPEAVTFNLVMNAHARGVQPRGARNAERLLERMLELHRMKTTTHNRRRTTAGDDDDGRDDAMAVKPTDRSFHTVLKAWANASPFVDDAARRAEDILRLMNELHLSDKNEWSELIPTTLGYNTVLSAWARSRRDGAARHAENLLRHMEGLAAEAVETAEAAAGEEGIDERHGIGGMAKVRPDRVSYNTVISAWSRSDDETAPERAQALLERMHEMHTSARQRRSGDAAIRPDNFGFSAAISAWCGRAYVDDDAAGRAQDLLDWMERLSLEEEKEDACDDDGDRRRGRGRERAVFVRPDVYNYVAVMKAWMRTRDGACPPQLRVERTSDLLRRMEDSYGRTGDHRVRPNTAAYNIVLEACASVGGCGESSDRDGGDEGTDEATGRYGPDDVFEIAWETFLKASDPNDRHDRTAAVADSRTYQLTLRAIVDLLPAGTEERIGRAQEVFERCCEGGLVTEGVFGRLREAILADQFDRMLPSYVTGGTVEYGNLPPEWTRRAGRRAKKGRGGRRTRRR